ncbi:MAG: hypothetical protein V3R73_08075 [Sphingomonadales bacterium]
MLDITPRGYHISGMETAWNPLSALLGLASLLLLLGAVQPSEASASAELCDPAAGLHSGLTTSEAITTDADHCHDAAMIDCYPDLAGGTCSGHGLSSCAGPAGAILGLSSSFESLLVRAQTASTGKSALPTRTINFDPPPPRI